VRRVGAWRATKCTVGQAEVHVKQVLRSGWVCPCLMYVCVGEGAQMCVGHEAFQIFVRVCVCVCVGGVLSLAPGLPQCVSSAVSGGLSVRVHIMWDTGGVVVVETGGFKGRLLVCGVCRGAARGGGASRLLSAVHERPCLLEHEGSHTVDTCGVVVGETGGFKGGLLVWCFCVCVGGGAKASHLVSAGCEL